MARGRTGARRRRRRSGRAPAARPRAQARPAPGRCPHPGDPGARFPPRRRGRPRRGAAGERADDPRERGGLRARLDPHRRALGHAARRPLRGRRDPLPRRPRARPRRGRTRVEGARRGSRCSRLHSSGSSRARCGSRIRARCRGRSSWSRCSSSGAAAHERDLAPLRGRGRPARRARHARARGGRADVSPPRAHQPLRSRIPPAWARVLLGTHPRSRDRIRRARSSSGEPREGS